MTLHSDVLVVGGGIAGVSAAARIAEHASVTVLERESALGYHSTGRSAALFFLNYGNNVIRALNAASQPVFENPSEFSGEPWLSPRGALTLARPGQEAMLAEHMALAPGAKALSPETACELVPTLRPETLAAAFIEEAAQDIDVDRVLQSFARTCRARGGKIVSDAEIVAARRENGLWQAETRTGERYAAPVLLNAAGAWGDQLAELAGVAPAGLQPCRRSAALIPVGGLDIAAWPMLVAVDESWYAKPDAGRLLVSPADEDPVEPHDAWPDDLVLAEGLDRFATMVDIPIPRLEHTWAGLRSFVPDRSPVAGFDADAEGFFWLVGQGGYGVQTCPALSQLAADLVLSHTPALAAETVAALSPHRLTRPAAVAS